MGGNDPQLEAIERTESTLKILPSTPDAYRLLQEGAIALAKVESNGIRVDTDYLDKTLMRVTGEVSELEKSLRSSKEYGKWRQRFGEKSTLGSRDQLGWLLFEEMDYKPLTYTETGKPKVDNTLIESIGIPFTDDYLRLARLKKVKETYLSNIKKETIHGSFHPNFNLHTAETFRSSSGSDKDTHEESSSLNFQNLPVRNPEFSEVIRRCFIPRKGNQLAEIDFSGIEVRISSCYNRDPVLIEYIKDPTKDMHRDMAAQIYMIKEKEVSKQTRYAAKNLYVFPQFYGSFYAQCAPSLWESIDKLKLERSDGVSLKEHLKEKGIKRLGACKFDEEPRPHTFERHVRDVEKDFWGRRFRVYAQWKKDWYEAYKEKGGFEMFTGFRVFGVYRRNVIINSPVQGAAFHCLLWTLIRIQAWLEKHNMKSVILGQIHDSLVLDIPVNELQDVLAACKRIMTLSIRKAWEWIIVPLAVEAEVTPVNGSWFEKKGIAI